MKKIELPPKAESKGIIDGISNIFDGLGLFMQAKGFNDKNNEDNSLPQLLSCVDKCNKDYLYWDKVKYQETPENTTNESLWLTLKSFRTLNSQIITFGQYNFRYYVTKHFQKILHQFDLEIGQLGGQNLLPEQDKTQYLTSSIMEEAIASSQIEGAVTTRRVAKEFLRQNKIPRDSSQQMILNNYRSIKYLSEIKTKDMTPELLCEIQGMITEKTLEKAIFSGKFRDSNDIDIIDSIDGEIVFTPPKAEEISQLVIELCNFFNNDDTDNFIHPIIKASILHFMVAYIHPFVDGNGRTARTIFYWYLLKKGYWLVEYLSISRVIAQSKNKYYKAFVYTETDDNDLSYFIHYQLVSLKKSLEELQFYVKKKTKEKLQVINFQKLNNINDRQAMVIQELHKNQDWVFNIKEIENRCGVSNQTARNDISGLLTLGYIELLKVNAKEQKYYKSDRFDTLI